jgi:hemoglobin-like flavoprotein
MSTRVAPNHARAGCDKLVRCRFQPLRPAVLPPDQTAPTETEIMLVRRTFDLIVPIGGVVADLFYDRLFYLAPSVRRMFPRDMREQKRSFTVMMATTVQNLDNLDALEPLARALGARHRRYGVTAGHYEIAGEALVWALERGLARDFTTQVEQAWRRAYALLATAMKAGGQEVVLLQAAE